MNQYFEPWLMKFRGCLNGAAEKARCGLYLLSAGNTQTCPEITTFRVETREQVLVRGMEKVHADPHTASVLLTMRFFSPGETGHFPKTPESALKPGHPDNTPHPESQGGCGDQIGRKGVKQHAWFCILS